MQAILNRQLFEATVFDSGALGLTTSVIHQFTTAGTYTATVRQNGKQIGNATFEVSEDTTTMQLDIDLATTERSADKIASCNCGTHKGAPQSVSSKGYVVFHATSGTGWSVQIGEGEKAAFDSTRLTKGDIFALTLLEPTRYKIENVLGSAKGTVEVGFTSEDIKRLSELEPVSLKVGKSFDPENFKLTSTQGLVFLLETDARIVISRKEKRKAEPKRGPIQFHRPKIAAPPPVRKT